VYNVSRSERVKSNTLPKTKHEVLNVYVSGSVQRLCIVRSAEFNRLCHLVRLASSLCLVLTTHHDVTTCHKTVDTNIRTGVSSEDTSETASLMTLLWHCFSRYC
jgi:hypothetical protein